MQNEELSLIEGKATESSDKYTELYDFAPAGYFTLDCEGIISGLNLNAAKMLGKGRAALVKSNFKLFITKDTLPAFIDFLKVVFESGKKESCELKLSNDKNKYSYLMLEGIVAKDTQKCLLIAINTSNQKVAEESARASAEEWQATFDSVKDAICILDNDQNILRCNKSMIALFQNGGKNVIGRKCSEVVHKSKKALFECPVNKMKKTLQRESMQLKLEDKWFEVTFDPMLDDGGKLKSIIHIVRDISQRKKSEENLKK